MDIDLITLLQVSPDARRELCEVGILLVVQHSFC
jgi:hypothetical protein